MSAMNNYLVRRPRVELKPGRRGFVVTYRDVDENVLNEIRRYQRILSASKVWTSRIDFSPVKETIELHVFPISDLPQGLMSALQSRPGYQRAV